MTGVYALNTLLSADATLYQALSKSVAQHPNHKALTYGTETLTFAQVSARIERLARGLRALGVKPGDRVAFLLPSCLDAPIAFFAPAALGAVVIPINPVCRQKELEHILADSEASVVIAEPRPLGNDLRASLEAIRPSLPHLKHIIWRGPVEPPELALDNLPTDADPLPAQAAQPESLCALVYTSGTTGVPKAVMHSHGSMIAAVRSQEASASAEPLPLQMWHFFQLIRTYGRRFMRLGSGPLTSLSMAPLHTLAGYGSVLYGLLLGNHTVIADRFHPARILELVEKQRINTFAVTPTMLTALLASPDLEKRDLSSLLLLFVSTAPVASDMVHQARAKLKCPVMIAFGLTEVGGSVMTSVFSDPTALQADTVGRLLPGVEAKIVDDQRRPVPQGQVGELAIRMSRPMLGYYKAPELTASTLDADGWYYTGDLVTVDARGYYRVAGRKKEMIVRGGQNIFPAEIENHLLTKLPVQNAAVVGVPDPIAGERVWAYVQPRPGSALTSMEVLDYFRKELTPSKVPDRVLIVDSLPLTSTGKVQKYLLREQANRERESSQR